MSGFSDGRAAQSPDLYPMELVWDELDRRWKQSNLRVQHFRENSFLSTIWFFLILLCFETSHCANFSYKWQDGDVLKLLTCKCVCFGNTVCELLCGKRWINWNWEEKEEKTHIYSETHRETWTTSRGYATHSLTLHTISTGQSSALLKAASVYMMTTLFSLLADKYKHVSTTIHIISMNIQYKKHA